MFVPDLLHEFELGVWKAIFTHLLRILYSCGGNTIQTLNSRYGTLTLSRLNINNHSRYRQIPTFGRDTIRKFDANVSAMKRLAARDWEDLLQVNCFISCYITIDLIIPSVQFLSSKTCCLSQLMMLLYGNCCSNCQHGMAWRNFACIRGPLCAILKTQPLDWAFCCGVFRLMQLLSDI